DSTVSGASGGEALGGAPAGEGIELELSAIAANGSIGLEWKRVPGALGYRVYWTTEEPLSLATADLLETEAPGIVHRGLVNGMTYRYVVRVVTAEGEGPVSTEITATPTGEWVLEQLGTGDFVDIVTGERVPRVPIEKRVHVMLLPEGYLASDLSTFHGEVHDVQDPENDVDRWLAEVFAIEPYSLFREAFVVWYLPRASSAHVGEGATAFGIGVSNGGISNVRSAAAPLFAAIDGAGADAFPYPPATPAVNHVAAFLVLDVTRSPA